MSTLEDWVAEAAAALNLPADSVTTERRDQLLDVTREVAHGVARVAGPLTTYLIGMAVGAGMVPAEAMRLVAEKAAAHTPDESDDAGDGDRDGHRRGHGSRHGDG